MSDIETLQKEYEAAQQNAEKAKLKLKAANAERFKSLRHRVPPLLRRRAVQNDRRPADHLVPSESRLPPRKTSEAVTFP